MTLRLRRRALGVCRGRRREEEGRGGKRREEEGRGDGRGWLCALGAEHVAERKMGNCGSFLLWIGPLLDRASLGLASLKDELEEVVEDGVGH